MIRAGVIGANGYAGAELVRILSGHPKVTLTVLTSRSYAGVAFDRIYPAMTGWVDLVCEEFDYESVCDRTDIVFIALPHKLPMEMVPELIRRGKKVVDLSADFRFADPGLYEAHYQPHSAKDLLEQAVYGLCEVNTEEIKGARLVGNPGCYPTSVLLPLVPLLQQGIVELDSIIADSKSGVSGAGRSLSLTTHFCEANESFRPYKVEGHRHQPEMEEVLSIAAGEPVSIIFVPHLVPMTRGMETTIYARPAKQVGHTDIHNRIVDYYSDCKFIRILDRGHFPDTRNVRNTNYCDIGFVVDRSKNRLIIMSVIDNLVKGAAGQAVQNMNLMLGLEETAGLNMPPFPL
ncbi:MAG TPA: N-acetyl-gamma-glutamyl-phosphate reductase [Desulfosalsimonadaceae bacterium]|nr:N-acetyl-gamma-glutamyl-phosphate reductase [Desulfosalsimonadaceae bacterium]